MKKNQNAPSNYAKDALPHDLLVATVASAAAAGGKAVGNAAVSGIKKLVKKAKPTTEEAKIFLTDKKD